MMYQPTPEPSRSVPPRGPSDPCCLCNGKGGWDRNGLCVTADAQLAPGERTKCFACDGTGQRREWPPA